MSAPQERWYFSREQLAESPSRLCGLDADKELAYRQQAANLIQDMGQRLQVSQLCINTAIVYMHRFYAFHSFTQFHRNAMASAALFLAAKVEEQPRKLEHVIKVSHMCLHRGDSQPVFDVQSKHYQEQAQDLVFNENVLLQTLGFDVAIDHPHTHVVRTCDLVKASKDLAQTSYFMASNSLHLTTMCLQYRPTVVACFCIHLASKWSNWAIPQSNEGKHWFYYVDRSVTSELLEHLTAEFLHIFDRCPARLKKKIMSITSQGTNSPQQAPSTSHSNNSSMSSQYDKDRKIPPEEMEKIEHDKRQQGLFGPSIPSNSTNMAPTPNKMDYREYKERQQQERRRPPNLLHNAMSRTSQEMASGQPRQQSSSSSSQRPPQNIPSQHRWPPNQRSKDPQSIRPHPSQSSSSRPHHRTSSSAIPPQLPQTQSLQPLPEQRPPSKSQPLTQSALPHPTRIHTQPQLPSQQILPSLSLSQPIQQPPHRPPSLFSPEPQRKPPPPRRPPIPSIPPSKEISVPAPLSPFSSSPPSMPQSLPEVEAIVSIKKEEPPPPSEIQAGTSVSQNNIETDPMFVSSLIKESLPHRSDKKKKKDKHKHKDRDKREEKRKHKKDKDKRRESDSNSNPVVSIAPPVVPTQNSLPQAATPLKITIPKEALSINIQPPSQTKLKIKIPKDRLRAEPPPVHTIQPVGSGLKIKIPKEYVDASRKRGPDSGIVADMLPHKAPRLPQQSHPQHKVSQQLQHQQQAAAEYSTPPPPLMMMYPPPALTMYQHHPPYFYPHAYSRPPPAPAVPPLPPLPPPPPPPPPP